MSTTDNNTRTKRIAVIRIRGRVNRSYTVEKTMNLLRLNRPNHCVVIDDRPTFTGMLQRAKDFLTWGEIDHDTFSLLIRKRGRLTGNKKIDDQYLSGNSEFMGPPGVSVLTGTGFFCS